MGPWVAAARHFAYYNKRILRLSVKSPEPDAVDRIAMLHPQRKQPGVRVCLRRQRSELNECAWLLEE